MKFLYTLLLSLSLTTIIHAQDWRYLDSLCYEYGEAKPDSAIILGKKAMEGCIKEKSKNSIEYAVCLDHIAWAYIVKSKYTIADSLYQEAIKTCKRINQTEITEYAEIINNSAIIYQRQARYNEAESMYLQVKDFRVKVLGRKHPDYATTCNNLADVYQAQGRYNEAESLYTEAKNIYIQVLGKENSYYALFCNNLARLYQTQGRYNEAEPLLIEAKDIHTKVLGKEHPEYANDCNNIATVYRELGRYSEAEPLFIEAKTIRAKVLGKENYEYANYCNNLAFLYEIQGRFNEAEPLYTEGKNIIAKVLGEEHPEYAQCFHDLANLNYAQGFYQKAESLYIEGKNIRAKTLGKQHPAYANSCNGLALLYHKQKKYSESERLYIEAKTIYDKVFGKEHHEYARSCNNLASLYQTQQKYDEAELLYNEAKTIRAKVYGKEDPNYANSCNNLASLYDEQGRYNEAELFYTETFTIKEKEIERNFKNLSETEKEKYIKTNIDFYNLNFLRFIRQRYVQNPAIAGYAYQIAISSKGLILSSTEKIKHRIIKSNDTELKKMFLEWKATRDKYNKVLNLSVEQKNEKKLNSDSLEKRANELEKILSSMSEDFTHVFTPKHVSWQDIQAKLKKDEAAVEIIRINLKVKFNLKDSTAYMAIVLKKGSKYPEIIEIPNGNELETKYLTNYRRSINSKTREEESYNMFWKPLQQKLKGIKTVYFSPDGVYHQINLATLQNPETKKYVFDKIRIIPVTNTKDILENKRNYNNNTVHLIGNPKYNLNMNIKGNEKPEQNRSIENLFQLEGAEKEVKQASSLFQNATVTIGELATEEYVKSLKSPRILHIATHGYFKKG